MKKATFSENLSMQVNLGFPRPIWTAKQNKTNELRAKQNSNSNTLKNAEEKTLIIGPKQLFFHYRYSCIF